jgi:H+/Cl- antiporter ClcA
MFIYLNVDPFERMYAHADGFPRWSLWQLLFTAPEGAVGALAGVLVVFLANLARRRTLSNREHPLQVSGDMVNSRPSGTKRR